MRRRLAVVIAAAFLLSAAQAQIPGIPGVPGMPSLPLPGLPDWGSLPIPQLPEIPGIPGLDDLPFPAITPDMLGPEGQAALAAYQACMDDGLDGCLETLQAELERLFGTSLPDIPGVPGLPEPEVVETAGYVDYIEYIDPAHWTERLPNVSIGVLDEFRACQGKGFEDCDNFTLSTPFWLKSGGDKVIEDEKKAWEKFVKAVAADIDKKLNEDPPCFIGGHAPSCLEVPLGIVPIPDPVCIALRVAQGLAESLPVRSVEYWQDVLTSLVTNLPNSIVWGATKVPFTAAISPVVDLPQPEQYFQGYTDDPREYLYFYQALQLLGYPEVPLPILPGDTTKEVPGLVPFENTKTNYSAATPYENQEFGFVTFFELYPEVRWAFFYDSQFLNFLPSLKIYCNLGVRVPLPPFMIPVPVFAPATYGASEFDSVAEGYYIPKLEGSPLLRPTY